jgi:hypothetical protein
MVSTTEAMQGVPPLLLASGHVRRARYLPPGGPFVASEGRPPGAQRAWAGFGARG